MKKNTNIYPITVVIVVIFWLPFHIHDVLYVSIKGEITLMMIKYDMKYVKRLSHFSDTIFFCRYFHSLASFYMFLFFSFLFPFIILFKI